MRDSQTAAGQAGRHVEPSADGTTLADAARFIAGEMSDDEADRYVASLGEDGACEALSDVVRMRDALAGATFVTPAKAAPQRRRSAGWAAAAAGVLLAAGGWTLLPLGNNPSPIASADGEIAAVWLAEAADAGDDVSGGWELSERWDVGDEWAMDAVGEGEDDVPSWMLSVALPELDASEAPSEAAPGLETL